LPCATARADIPGRFRLKSATADLRDASGDDRLDSVLAEIELRLEVEMGPPRWVNPASKRPVFSENPAANIPCLSAPRRDTISSPREQGGSFE
jgi:hypothetical protein